MPTTAQEYQALQDQDTLNEAGENVRLRGPTEGFSSEEDDDGSATRALNKSELDNTPRRSPPRAGEHAVLDGRSPRRPWRRLCASLKPSKRVCLILSVVLAIFLGAAIGGGAWVYKSAPKDGLSPPWYPTPLGGTTKSWEESYKKARQMVGDMSLVEKVNITTGTGYVCPG
jgi:hypothetical protein